MRLEQLQYFVQIVEAHSFNKAAQKLNITQPALTNAVRSLEEEIGVQLLVRSRHGTIPTAWGIHIYEDCKSLLGDLAARMAAWKNLGKTEKGPAVVPFVAIPSACNYLVEKVLPAIRREAPQIDILLHEATAYELFPFLQAGNAHIAVTAFTDEEAERDLPRLMGSSPFCCYPLLRDEYRIFLSSEHPLAQKEYLNIEDCRSLNFATYSNQYKKRNAIFHRIAAQLGLQEWTYVDSRENIMQMIARNRTAGCFLYRMASYDWYIVNGLIRALPVHGITLLPSQHYLIALEDHVLNTAEQYVVDFVLRHYNEDGLTE